MKLNKFSSPLELADNLANLITNKLTEAIETKELASLVVSGGSTPKLLFKTLKAKDLDWSKTYITIADERLVDVSSDDSNEKLVRDLLLRPEGNFVSLTEKPPKPYDIVILGMGEDGHTASIFPNMDNIKEAFDDEKTGYIKANPGGASHPRVTQTLSSLLDSKQIIIHIEGINKLDTLEKALLPGPCEEIPIRAILEQEKVPVEVYWSP